jgi:hypothetical protein
MRRCGLLIEGELSQICTSILLWIYNAQGCSVPYCPIVTYKFVYVKKFLHIYTMRHSSFKILPTPSYQILCDVKGVLD